MVQGSIVANALGLPVRSAEAQLLHLTCERLQATGTLVTVVLAELVE